MKNRIYEWKFILNLVLKISPLWIFADNLTSKLSLWTRLPSVAAHWLYASDRIWVITLSNSFCGIQHRASTHSYSVRRTRSLTWDQLLYYLVKHSNPKRVNKNWKGYNRKHASKTLGYKALQITIWKIILLKCIKSYIEFIAI